MTNSSWVCNGVVHQPPGINEYAVASFVMVAIGATVCLSGNLFIFINRKAPVMIVSQHNLLHWFCFGLFMLNMSGIARTLNAYAPFSNSLCMAQLWLIHISMTFIIAVLTAKEWKTWKIRVRTAQFRRFHIPENLLLLYVGCSLTIICIILTLWTALDPSTIEPCENFQCSSHSSVWFWLAIAFQICQSLVMLYIAWKDWGMGKVGGESWAIFITALALVFALTCFFVATVVNVSTGENPYSTIDFNSLEALISYALLALVSALAVASIVFAKGKYCHLGKDEVLRLFISPSSSRMSSQKETQTQERILQFEKQSWREKTNSGTPQDESISEETYSVVPT